MDPRCSPLMRHLRVALWPLALAYRGGVGLRNALFDRGLRSVGRLPVPVISVGNLSAGGTGKTPLVVWLVEALRARGRRPGVLARGYGRPAPDQLNDEGAMLAARFPDLPQVQDPDRVGGGARLLRLGADVVVLDDGFQHRRLERDEDLVCLDARAPFGNGLLLPAGDLREPPSALRRATAVVLTRAGDVDAARREASAALVLRAAGRRLPVHFADHRPLDLVAMPAGERRELASLRGRRVALLSAIARPAVFAATVRRLGAEVVWSVARRDHHRYQAAEVGALVERAERDGLWLLVTEKDAPKLAGFGLPHQVLRIGLEFADTGPADRLDALLSGS